MAAPGRIVVVGASLAGATAAAVLREEGFEGALTLVGEEPRPPYERPPLSKEYLRGEEPFESALVRPPEFYPEAGIELRTGVRASAIDLDARRVRMDDGDALEFDALLLATGAVNRRLSVPGADLDGVLDLRTVEDADRIRAAASGARRAVVVGMGFIGAEVTASLRRSGLEVTVVEVFSTALERALGPEVGRAIEAIHRDEGAELRFEDGVEAFEGDGRVERVRTVARRRGRMRLRRRRGRGSSGDASWPRRRGSAVDDGVLVDELARTSAPRACSRPATWPAMPIRCRRRPSAWSTGRTRSSRGRRRPGRCSAGASPTREVHWFWSDQYESRIEYAGVHAGHDEVVVRGSIEDVLGSRRSTSTTAGWSAWPRSTGRATSAARRSSSPPGCLPGAMRSVIRRSTCVRWPHEAGHGRPRTDGRQHDDASDPQGPRGGGVRSARRRPASTRPPGAPSPAAVPRGARRRARAPRLVWVMVPAGSDHRVDLTELGERLGRGRHGHRRRELEVHRVAAARGRARGRRHRVPRLRHQRRRSGAWRTATA